MGQVRCCAGNDDRCPSRPPSCGRVRVRAPGIILLPAFASGRTDGWKHRCAACVFACKSCGKKNMPEISEVVRWTQGNGLMRMHLVLLICRSMSSIMHMRRPATARKHHLKPSGLGTKFLYGRQDVVISRHSAIFPFTWLNAHSQSGEVDR